MVTDLQAFKNNGDRRLAALTAYDYPSARLLDEAGTDLILVGDSLGMVVLGYEDTTGVTMADMLHHLAAARRGVSRAHLAVDLPFGSYPDSATALTNARALMECGADSVKLEGGLAQAATVAALTAAQIPVVGHIGMLPQQVRAEGGYSKKGKTPESASRLLEDARALEAAGAIAIVLESMVAAVASDITRAVSIPTIGIGAGTGTDGQILVLHDLIGAFPWFRPSFAKTYADVAGTTSEAVRRFCHELQHPG